MKTFKLTARRADGGGYKWPSGKIEPYVDWFDVETEADAITAWKQLAEDCGVDPKDIELVSVEECDPTTLNPIAK